MEKRTGSSPGKKEDPCACLVWRAAGPRVEQGPVPKTQGFATLFLKTGMNWKQKTLNHHDQGKKEKVNDGKEVGPPHRFLRLAAAHSRGNSSKILQKNFSSYVLKNLPGQSVPVVQYPNIQETFQEVSHPRAHYTASPAEVSGIGWLELRTQPFKYKILKSLKYQYIVHSMQQAWKGSGKDGAFMVSTERT